MPTAAPGAASAAASLPLHFLGGLTAERFLRDHWQKRPLLVRDAFPGFEGLLTPDELAGLACLEEAQSRLVRHQRGRWLLEEGPFTEARFARLPRTRWSLLVQGVNHFLPEAEHLLQVFSFIPHARLDDLMVSYAPTGGSVGPHFDSYDVFLLQGRGRRRWQVSRQHDMELVEGAPLRILQRFEPDGDWVLGPGDLLYLPPRYAHYGVAQGECMTYSIGFRAPTARELCSRFLEWLPDHLRAGDQTYADPDLKPPRHPSEIGDAMVQKVAAMLSAVRWDQAMVGRFLGQYLSEPKPHILFERPARPMNRAAFARRVAENGLRLSLKSLMLLRDGHFYLNGESIAATRANRATLLHLADDRRLPPGRYGAEPLGLLYGWYRCGWAEFPE